MKKSELEQIIQELPNKTVVVLGDFFLDKYLLIDPNKDEPSIETGLTAYQVVGKRISPGAAGTITNNLSALGVGRIIALGFIGHDGEGKELLKGLRDSGVETEDLILATDRVTPTYMKPMRQEQGQERELNRFDIKNWKPTSTEVEDQVIARLIKWAEQADAIIVLDQVEEENHGVVTQRVKEALTELGQKKPNLPIIADSRAYISTFQHVLIKTNHIEALTACGLKTAEHEDEQEVYEKICHAGASLREKTKRPVFITHGKHGQYIVDEQGVRHIPGIKVQGPIDIVGAGDSTTAGIISALCTGFPLIHAALLGNLVASITIQKLGTTGTATPAEMISRWEENRQMFSS